VAREAPLQPAASDRLDGAIEALADGVALFDEEARLVLCNGRYRALNPPVAELLAPGLAWELLLREAHVRGGLPEEAQAELEWMESRLAEGAAEVEPIEIEWADGSVHMIALRPTRDGGFVVCQSDVTVRRRDEAGERQADVLLRKVLEACPANVIMSRIGDGQVIYRSPAATGLLGTTRNTGDYFASREERADFVTALLPDGRVEDMRATCLRPDGTPFPSAISARVIEYRGEDVVVSTIEDLSAQVAMERELAAQREIVFQAEKMSALGELLAGVAHELNNPLSVVVGHALMLREEATDPEAVRRIEKIGQAAERCAGIVRTFLAMARQQPAALGPVDVAETVAAAADAFEQGPNGGRLRVEVALADGLPPILADGDQIAQVLINLLTNADQAIEAAGTGGTARVTARLDRPGGMVELRVADDGPGVPPAIRGRIFDPLFTTKAVGKGTGIGLAFCHRVVTAHGGRIRLEAGPGRGASFAIALPVAGAAARRRAAERPLPAAVAPRARVLVVDDEADVAELMRDILTMDGFEVDHAASGEAALERIAERDYALVLTDLAMPGMGGRGFFEAVARERPALAARVGFVTGDTMSPAARGFLDATGRPYLEKPITPPELRAMARRMLAEALR
jgi:signal transduction histidine kinase